MVNYRICLQELVFGRVGVEGVEDVSLLDQVGVDGSNKSFAEHVKELLNVGKLQNFFVDHQKHELEVLAGLPLQHVVLVDELLPVLHP